MSEIKRIMDYFDVSQIEGNVRGEHFGKLLALLKKYDGKRLSFVMRVAPLFLGGMQKRNIRENYLEGLIELGIVKLYSKNNDYYYKWIGESALDSSLIISKPKDVLKELENIEKEETKEGLCPNCKKPLLENQKYCNEDCLREYLKNKKGKK